MSQHPRSFPDATSREAWQKNAACRAPGIDPDLFFPDKNSEGIGEARAVCAMCPVRRACLLDCLRLEGGRSSVSRWGVYAGLTPRQRERLHHKLRDRSRKASA